MIEDGCGVREVHRNSFSLFACPSVTDRSEGPYAYVVIVVSRLVRSGEFVCARWVYFGFFDEFPEGFRAEGPIFVVGRDAVSCFRGQREFLIGLCGVIFGAAIVTLFFLLASCCGGLFLGVAAAFFAFRS